jgi:hypothetical protein
MAVSSCTIYTYLRAHLNGDKPWYWWTVALEEVSLVKIRGSKRNRVQEDPAHRLAQEYVQSGMEEQKDYLAAHHSYLRGARTQSNTDEFWHKQFKRTAKWTEELWMIELRGVRKIEDDVNREPSPDFKKYLRVRGRVPRRTIRTNPTAETRSATPHRHWWPYPYNRTDVSNVTKRVRCSTTTTSRTIR